MTPASTGNFIQARPGQLEMMWWMMLMSSSGVRILASLHCLIPED